MLQLRGGKAGSDGDQIPKSIYDKVDLWSRSGLFGNKELRPNGGLLARWLRGTGLGPYELVIWAVGFSVADLSAKGI